MFYGAALSFLILTLIYVRIIATNSSGRSIRLRSHIVLTVVRVHVRSRNVMTMIVIDTRVVADVVRAIICKS